MATFSFIIIPQAPPPPGQIIQPVQFAGFSSAAEMTATTTAGAMTNVLAALPNPSPAGGSGVVTQTATFSAQTNATPYFVGFVTPPASAGLLAGAQIAPFQVPPPGFGFSASTTLTAALATILAALPNAGSGALTATMSVG